MAVIETAEQDKYFSAHDSRIGGTLCADCEESLVWVESTEEGLLVMIATHCNKTYILKESLGFKMKITEDSK